MSAQFTAEEKKQFQFRRHLRDHLLEYVLDILAPVLLAATVLWLGQAQRWWPGLAFAALYGIVRAASGIYHYKKEYLDLEVSQNG